MNNMHTPNQGQNQSNKNAGSFDKSSVDKNLAGRKADDKNINKDRRDSKDVDQRRS